MKSSEMIEKSAKDCGLKAIKQQTSFSECEKPTLEDHFESYLLLLQELQVTDPRRYRDYLLRLSDLITELKNTKN